MVVTFRSEHLDARQTEGKRTLRKIGRSDAFRRRDRNRLRRYCAFVFVARDADVTWVRVERACDRSRGCVRREIALFETDEDVIALTAWLVSRNFFDDEVFRLGFYSSDYSKRPSIQK